MNMVVRKSRGDFRVVRHAQVHAVAGCEASELTACDPCANRACRWGGGSTKRLDDVALVDAVAKRSGPEREVNVVLSRQRA